MWLDNIIFVNVELQDDYLAKGLGTGWPYKLAQGTLDYNILSCTIKNKAETINITDPVEIKATLLQYDLIVGHNIMTILGALETIGFNSESLCVVDTQLLACLCDSTLPYYSLNRATTCV